MKTTSQNHCLHLCLAVLAVGALLLPRDAGAVRYVITTVAGNGTQSYSGDGGYATAASLDTPTAVALDSSGDLFIADNGNYRIRRVIKATGQILTYGGTGVFGSDGDNGPAISAKMVPWGLAFATNDDLYFSDGNVVRYIRRLDSKAMAPVIGSRVNAGWNGDGTPATSYWLNGPCHLSFMGTADLLIAESNSARIRVVSGITSYTNAGDGSFTYGGDGLGANDKGVGVQPMGVRGRGTEYYIADTANQCIRKVNAANKISTVAGIGSVTGSSGDEGPATSARLTNPRDVAFDINGDMLILDSGNSRLRRVGSDGNIYHVAGDPASTGGCAGDGGYADLAKMWLPSGLFVDSIGCIYIADTENHRIRKLSPAPEIVLTKEATATVATDGTITYRISWQNNGAGTAFSMEITDTLSTEVSFVAVSSTHAQADTDGTPTVTPATGTAPGALLRFSVSRIGIGKSGSVTFTVLAPHTATNGQVITNRAAATVAGLDVTFVSNAVTTSVTVTSTGPGTTAGNNQTSLKDRLTTGSILVAPNVIDLSRPGSAISIVVKATKAAPEVVIYNEEGTPVRTVPVAIGADGKGFVTFDGLDDGGKKLGPGIYWALLKGAPAGEKRRFVVVPKKK
jgi:uncharacterized repeat protein (TIGR01451 family)